jgi:hypothetical protein
MNPIIPPCEKAGHTRYLDQHGKPFEQYWLDGALVLEQEIPGFDQFSRTHPGWIAHDRGLCQWANNPPPRTYGAPTNNPVFLQENPPPPPVPIQSASVASAGDSGGAFLILLGVIGAAGYALYQWKFGKSDEEIAGSDYHPMSDVPALPAVYTDENLDVLYGRVGHPQHQGIQEPNPWHSTPVYPQIHGGNSTTPPPQPTYNPPVESTDFSTGGTGSVDPKQHFELTWLPAPSRGYFLGEESILSNSSQAKKIVRDALKAGVSINFLMSHVFKISKNTKGHELLKELVSQVAMELGHE